MDDAGGHGAVENALAVVMRVDVLFFDDHPRERLLVDVGIVLVFGAFYLRFLRN